MRTCPPSSAAPRSTCVRHTADREASVDALALFGGVDVPVPKGWRIALGGTPILGGCEDKTGGDGELPADAPVLRVHATAILGGVDVKNETD